MKLLLLVVLLSVLLAKTESLEAGEQENSLKDKDGKKKNVETAITIINAHGGFTKAESDFKKYNPSKIILLKNNGVVVGKKGYLSSNSVIVLRYGGNGEKPNLSIWKFTEGKAFVTRYIFMD